MLSGIQKLRTKLRIMMLRGYHDILIGMAVILGLATTLLLFGQLLTWLFFAPEWPSASLYSLFDFARIETYEEPFFNKILDFVCRIELFIVMYASSSVFYLAIARLDKNIFVAEDEYEQLIDANKMDQQDALQEKNDEKKTVKKLRLLTDSGSIAIFRRNSWVTEQIGHPLQTGDEVSIILEGVAQEAAYDTMKILKRPSENQDNGVKQLRFPANKFKIVANIRDSETDLDYIDYYHETGYDIRINCDSLSFDILRKQIQSGSAKAVELTMTLMVPTDKSEKEEPDWEDAMFDISVASFEIRMADIQ